MEGNTNWKPNEQGGDSLPNNPNDWRSQHDPDLRKRVIAKIVEKVKEYFPKRCPDERQHEIYNSAAIFEEKTYATAKNKDDYLQKLSERMHMMEKAYQNKKHFGSSVNPTNTPNPAAQVVNQAQPLPTSLPYTQNSRSQQLLQQNTQSNLNMTAPSGLPNQAPINISVAKVQNVNIHISERVEINVIPGAQRQMQGRQQHLPQQQQAQNSNNMFQNRLNQQRPPHMHQLSQSPPQQQQQQQSFPQSSFPSSGQQNPQFQPRHQFSTQQKQDQDRIFSQLMNQDPQQRQNTGEKQGAFRVSSSQQNNISSYQAMAQQQQNMPRGGQSGNYNVPRPSFMGTQGQEMGQTQQTMLQQYQPQHHTAQQPQDRSLPQHFNPGKNDTLRFQAASSLRQSQNITDQQIQQCQFERAPLANQSTSQDSTGRMVNANGGNWQEETYQKIKALKEKHFHIISAMYQRFTDKLRQTESLSRPEHLAKLKVVQSMLTQIIVFLNVERNTISEKHRDLFDQCKGQILRYTKHYQTELPRPMQSQSHQVNSQLISMPPSLQTRHNDLNIMTSSGNVVLPSLIQNRASNPQVQSSMLEQPKPNLFHHHQMQQQPLHRQQQQQERQTHTQHQKPTIQPKNEMNDVRMKQGINKAELLQQHLSSSSRQLLMPMASQGRMSNISPLPLSPQLVDQQILPAKVNKTGTPIQSGGSPFVSQSPMTSFAPSPVSRDLDKPISVEYPVAQSPLKVNLNSADELGSMEQPPPVSLPLVPMAERPIDRLIKALQSSSPENLAESVNEIRSVVNLVDRFAGPFHPGGLGEDLSARRKFPFLTNEETNPSKRMKRTISALPRDIALQTDTNEQFISRKYEVGSMASSSLKFNKIEPRSTLLQEIKEINGMLMETVLEISDEVTSGTIVTCSYYPVALSATYKAHYMSGKISQIQPLRVLIPANYPNSSPILLDEISSDARLHIYEDLSARTRSRFSLSMKEVSDPSSLKEIAQMWNDCARATLAEYAERHGGGTFSSKYGPWETVLGAS